MAVAAVVGHEIDQYPQAVVVGAGNKRVRLLERAEVRVDIAIVAESYPPSERMIELGGDAP